jgi:hypothetical protein
MTDRPGTCHLVGCPGKGEHEPHTGTRPPIGCPDTFEPYQQQNRPARVLLEQSDVAALLDLLAVMPQRGLTFDHRDLIHRVSKALATARNTATQ